MEDLIIATIQLSKHVSDRQELWKKHHFPISMDSRNGKPLNSSVATPQKHVFPITRVFSDSKWSSGKLVSPVVSNGWIHNSSIPLGIDDNSAWFWIMWPVGGVVKQMRSRSAVASIDEKRQIGVLDDWTENVWKKQPLPIELSISIPSGCRLGISISVNSPDITLQNHGANGRKIHRGSLERSQWGKVFGFIHSFNRTSHYQCVLEVEGYLVNCTSVFTVITIERWVTKMDGFESRQIYVARKQRNALSKTILWQ